MLKNRKVRPALMLSLVRDGENGNICLAIKGGDIAKAFIANGLPISLLIRIRNTVRTVSALGLINANGERFILEQL